MTDRTVLTLQILEKLGTPLMRSLVEATARQPASLSDSPTALAERMAALLSRTVQTGVHLSSRLGFNNAEGGGESVNLALTAVAAQLVAVQYGQTGQVPDETALARSLTALEAVVAFGDNFSPAADNVRRLATLETTLAQGPVDALQVDIQFVNALLPVVNSIADFSFGLPEKKLVQDVATRLLATAADVRRGFIPDTAGLALVKAAELSLLKSLVSLYGGCHAQEKARLAGLNDAERAQSTGDNALNALWSAFDIRVTMIETLGQTLKSGTAPAGQGARAPVTTPAVPAEPPAAPAVTSSAPPPVAPPVPPATPEVFTAPPVAASATSGEGYNPMAFFKPGAKKAEDTASSGGEGA